MWHQKQGQCFQVFHKVQYPILFLIFINDLAEYVESNTNADDLILDWKIAIHSDRSILQDDLNNLNNLTFWEGKWGMQFHPDKCEIIHISKSNNPNKHLLKIPVTDKTKY